MYLTPTRFAGALSALGFLFAPVPVPAHAYTVVPVPNGGQLTIQVVHAGKRYAFCCADCQPEFEKNPGKYIKN